MYLLHHATKQNNIMTGLLRPSYVEAVKHLPNRGKVFTELSVVPLNILVRGMLGFASL